MSSKEYYKKYHVEDENKTHRSVLAAFTEYVRIYSYHLYCIGLCNIDDYRRYFSFFCKERPFFADFSLDYQKNHWERGCIVELSMLGIDCEILFNTRPYCAFPIVYPGYPEIEAEKIEKCGIVFFASDENGKNWTEFDHTETVYKQAEKERQWRLFNVPDGYCLEDVAFIPKKSLFEWLYELQYIVEKWLIPYQLYSDRRIFLPTLVGNLTDEPITIPNHYVYVHQFDNNTLNANRGNECLRAIELYYNSTLQQLEGTSQNSCFCGPDFIEY